MPVVAGAPFSGAVRVGDTLYMSGALGTKDRKLAEGGTGPETAQALENIKARLAEHGLEMSDVVKCTVFLSDMADFGAHERGLHGGIRGTASDQKRARREWTCVQRCS